MPGIPLLYYLEKGFAGVVRLGSTWKEESGGYENEHTHETVAVRSPTFAVLHAYLYKRTKGRADFSIERQEPITEVEYARYCQENGPVRDSPEWHARRAEFDQINREISQLERETPSCPRCGASLEPKSGRYGDFWGCSAWPQCRHTQKNIDPAYLERMDALQARRDAAWEALRALPW
jgi:hypothetical protein